MGNSSSTQCMPAALDDNGNDVVVVVVVVGEEEFHESRDFLCSWSGYFKDELTKNPERKRFDFSKQRPSEWNLLKKAVIALQPPFAEESSVNASNYHVLLPWFAELRCEDGLRQTDMVILKGLVEPLMAKPEKERTPEDTQAIVTVLERCVMWKRDYPKEKCATFLSQVLQDPKQPFDPKEVCRVALLLSKDDTCQKALWKSVV
ncbi:expressed unknown protein [Seminavis robusta]|uniref:BTB domain-containing protein n=1 Tax=Seminavis robusta TaxID=568900 RepID=A0A9N8ENJ3_9STRA|nr:expressed unknown protein [Seminavis robusta]|eukprot:Sro1474_g275720.1 n/a (204) ;mRNA; r:11655-12266